MTDHSWKTRNEQTCPVCIRLMRSGNNHPGKCRSCTVDHKCDICSEWTDKVWTGIVERTRARSSRKSRSTPAMTTDSPSLLTDPGGSSMSNCSFRGFSPSPERFREDNQDLVMDILRLLRHQQNRQPTVLSTSSEDVPGMVNAAVLQCDNSWRRVSMSGPSSLRSPRRHSTYGYV